MEHVEDRLAALEAELVSLRAQVAAAPARPASAPATAAVAEEVNRRALIRKGGLALAGAAAGGAALLAGTSSPAGAADGGNMIIGATNSATSKTILRTTSGSAQVFELEPFSNTVAPLRIWQQLASATPAGGAGDTGSLGVRLRDAGGADLWFAHVGDDKASSGPVTWGRVLTSAYANYTLYEDTPKRKADTRSVAKPVDGSTSTFTLAGAPATAVGCVGTITITDTTSPGSYASVYNGNLATIASPGFSHVNADANQSVATTFTSALGASKSIKVYVFKSCHVIIDIAAWIVVAP